MNTLEPKIRAADHLVDQLVSQGIDHVYGVPGESYLAVLDALHGREQEIQFVTCRQEGGAAMAADAYAKLTGKPGVCFVTRGPGATNASAGVHVAYQDSTPLILFIGQVAREFREREAFQEMDYRRMFGQMAKWIAEIDDASRIQEFITRAIRIAMSGRPGPVVLALPEDMLNDLIQPPKPPQYITTPRFQPATESLNTFKSLIASAQRPLIIAGGGAWTQEGMEALRTFSELQKIPVALSFRCQSLMDNDHENYVGHFSVGQTPYLADALAASDLLISIGARLGEITTAGYSLIDAPVPTQKLVHVFPAGEELGRVFEPTLALVSDTQSFCQAIAQWEPIAAARFADQTVRLRQDFVQYNSVTSVNDDPIATYFEHLNDVMPSDTIYCNGAGNYAGWVHRFIRYRSPGSQLAPTSGSMGYGLPAAIAAATVHPEREIIAFAGDGCFMMTCQEMATACHHQLNLIVIVVDNSRYGTIRAHQEREFPSRVSGTGLTNPDFCALAKSFGAQASRVESESEFKQALTDARAHEGVYLIEIPLDQSMLSPGKRLQTSE